MSNRVIFWQNKTPYIWDGISVVPAAVRGTPIRSTARWCYITVKGDNGITLHAYNGTDAKWFDNLVWRDIGLPRLTKDQGDNVVLTSGLAGLSDVEIAAVTLTFNSGGSWVTPDAVGRLVYASYFDPTTNERSPATAPLHNSTRIKGAAGQKLDIAALPVSAYPKLLGITPDGVSGADWCYSVFKTGSGFSYAGDVVTATVNGHGFSTGDIVLFNTRVPGVAFNFKPVSITVVNANQFRFNFTAPGTYNGIIVVYKLIKVLPGTTTATISNPALVVRDSSFPFNSSASGPQGAGIPASTIGGAQPGYLLFASIYNPTTGHIGNRRQLSSRLNNTKQANFILTGLPDVSALDSEWVLLLGRSSDGGEIPYAIINSDGSWATVPAGATNYTITQSDIDGDAELPSRNFPPPGTLDYNDQIAPDTPVIVTFKRAWQEGDRCCGTLEGSPTVYRSGSAQDTREGTFVGIPEHSWDPIDIETFPLAQPITCGQAYNGESWIYSKHHSAALIELAGELQWQGPWNEGCVGQHAWTIGWKSLPFWVNGKRQLVSIDGMGPIVISDEYEAALLSKIGKDHLAETEVNYIRHPEKRVDVLRIHARDSNNQPFTVIHDFNLRDSESPMGQGYSEKFGGPLRGGVWVTAPQLIRANNVVQAIFTSPPFSTAAIGASIYVASAPDSTFKGVFPITSVVTTPTGQTITWNQKKPDAATINADMLISQLDVVILNPTLLTRTSGIVKASLPAPRIGIFTGEEVFVAGADDPSFDGTFIVSEIDLLAPSISWLQKKLAVNGIINAGWDEFDAAFATFLGAVPAGAVVGGSVLIENTIPAFLGTWHILSVTSSGGQFTIQFTILPQDDLQSNGNAGGAGTFYENTSDATTNVNQISISVPTPTTEAMILDANEEEQIVSSAGDGRLYLLYDTGNDVGIEFVAEALRLFYLGPDRKAAKFIEWYGDFNVEWFISKKLGINFDTTKMTQLGVDPVKDVAIGAIVKDTNQQGDNHWQVAIDDPEMEHAFLLMRLTSHSADGTTDLNDPPHMPLESYGRVWLVSPLIGGNRPK